MNTRPWMDEVDRDGSWRSRSKSRTQDITILNNRSTLLTAGFTLVEVLVALAVLTIALAAVMRAMSQSIDTSASLRDRTIAMWVAQNRLTTHQVTRDFPALDTTEGDAEMAGRAWRWREEVKPAPDEPDMRQVHIEVRAASGEQPLARLVGFLTKP
jgi:general secretion pathway protein I